MEATKSLQGKIIISAMLDWLFSLPWSMRYIFLLCLIGFSPCCVLALVDLQFVLTSESEIIQKLVKQLATTSLERPQ